MQRQSLGWTIIGVGAGVAVLGATVLMIPAEAWKSGLALPTSLAMLAGVAIVAYGAWVLWRARRDNSSPKPVAAVPSDAMSAFQRHEFENQLSEARARLESATTAHEVALAALEREPEGSVSRTTYVNAEIRARGDVTRCTRVVRELEDKLGITTP
ncbi:hypothetical protein [Microbacterium sp. C7(2022)]|uniref:hypothetical protein n=1 Tax=Microbacterium sp. C7(2022) TaxID=2992759 RepID=UPI00237BC413|nr:hypothetical protein [Microbacterium sp. C7(2022)]MDE0545385.1 hypothetical protein [Microbacterium sp. C7(2022)]